MSSSSPTARTVAWPDVATLNPSIQMFVSYAQNSEDVVLWRALGDVDRGTYVDVGAADPTIDSVTRAFYDRGWSGVNVEPVPAYATALIADRPNDQTFEVCAGAESGTTLLHVVADTGLSTEVDDQLEAIRAQHYSIEDLTVEVRRLDEILNDAGLINQPIHFLKIDVEGSEAAVLRGIDLTLSSVGDRCRSDEADVTEPSFSEWEPILTSNGYVFCLFDGLNRFYLSQEHQELEPALSYPACVFDEPVASGHEVLAASGAVSIST